MTVTDRQETQIEGKTDRNKDRERLNEQNERQERKTEIQMDKKTNPA